MKKLIRLFTPIIFASSTLFISSSTLARPAPAEVIQPLMDCLNQSIPAEKAKAAPSKRGIKDHCAKELQALSALQPDVKASILSQIDKGLDRHMADMPSAAVDMPKVK